jgi:hypothetical protein
LHTAEGVVTIPFTFQNSGDYTVNVFVYGVDFTPTIPHVTAFPCKDIPEFPIGVVGLVAMIMGMGIIISSHQKLHA